MEEDESFNDITLSGRIGSKTLKTFFHDLSSEALTFTNKIYCREASSTVQFCRLRNIFGTGYGYGVRRAKVTKKGGLTSLGVFEKINAVIVGQVGNVLGCDEVNMMPHQH